MSVNKTITLHNNKENFVSTYIQKWKKSGALGL